MARYDSFARTAMWATVRTSHKISAFFTALFASGKSGSLVFI